MRIWCLGNVLFGDDAVGCKVAELLVGKRVAGVVDCGVTPENYIATLRAQPPSTLLIVDAADMGLAPGELRRLSIKEWDSNTAVSHGVPLSLLLSPFAGAIEIVVLGIQPAATQLGAALSESAERAACRVANLIERGEWDKVEKLL